MKDRLKKRGILGTILVTISPGWIDGSTPLIIQIQDLCIGRVKQAILTQHAL